MDIRRANKGDFSGIGRILHGLDLDHPGLAMDNFWVAVDGGSVIGVAHFEGCGEISYLSAVGVESRRQGEGVGTHLVRGVLRDVKGAVYIYTTVPGFFRRLGFEESSPHPAVPSKEIYNCRDGCDVEKCVCMVRSV